MWVSFCYPWESVFPALFIKQTGFIFFFFCPKCVFDLCKNKVPLTVRASFWDVFCVLCVHTCAMLICIYGSAVWFEFEYFDTFGIFSAMLRVALAIWGLYASI